MCLFVFDPCAGSTCFVSLLVCLVAFLPDMPPGKIFPLSEWAAAVAESQQVGRLGKVLLKLH